MRRLLKTFEWYGQQSPQKQKYQFWKHDNDSFYFNISKMTQQKINYIHQNQVISGFVNEVNKWRLSIANLQSPIKFLAL